MMHGRATAYTFSKSVHRLKDLIGLCLSFTYIADRRTDTGDGIDGGGVQAGKIVRKSVWNIESPPIGLSWRAVDKKHDAKGDRVRDGEADSHPYEPRPALAICAFHQSSIKEENRHFRASAAYEEAELA